MNDDSKWSNEASEEIQKLTDKYWVYFSSLPTPSLNKKERPPVIYSGEDCFGANAGDFILIPEKCETRNIEDILLEELLHYRTNTDKPETSADFSEEFHKFILHMIHLSLIEENQREFQDILITELKKAIQFKEYKN